jgi:hypothetical protein
VVDSSEYLGREIRPADPFLALHHFRHGLLVHRRRKMRHARTLYGWFAKTAAIWLPAVALAAGGKTEPIVFVADSRRYAGWMAWWINLYNENLVYFTVVTVLTIPAVGVLLGTLTDFFMTRLGINLKYRTLAEH